jgi:hypothetical protein
VRGESLIGHAHMKLTDQGGVLAFFGEISVIVA